MKIRLCVTQKDIDVAIACLVKEDDYFTIKEIECPIAQSFKRRFKTKIHVTTKNLWTLIDDDKLLKVVQLPNRAMKFVKAFDEDFSVIKPIQFDIDIPWL